jgi:membrane protein implicated in regulation of membrane protease activity
LITFTIVFLWFITFVILLVLLITFAIVFLWFITFVILLVLLITFTIFNDKGDEPKKDNGKGDQQNQ